MPRFRDTLLATGLTVAATAASLVNTHPEQTLATPEIQHHMTLADASTYNLGNAIVGLAADWLKKYPVRSPDTLADPITGGKDYAFGDADASLKLPNGITISVGGYTESTTPSGAPDPQSVRYMEIDVAQGKDNVVIDFVKQNITAAEWQHVPNGAGNSYAQAAQTLLTTGSKIAFGRSTVGLNTLRIDDPDLSSALQQQLDLDAKELMAAQPNGEGYSPVARDSPLFVVMAGAGVLAALGS